MEKLKTCGHCKRILSHDNFSLCRRAKDGLQPHCKECASQISREHRAKKRLSKTGTLLAEKLISPKRPELVQTPASKPLSAYTPRELMKELKNRGYEGELTFVQRIKLRDL